VLEIKIECRVSMSQQEISNSWPSIYWKHFDSSLQLNFEGYKEANSELWKEGENSTLRPKLHWRNYLLHTEFESLCPLSLNTVSNPQTLHLLMDKIIVSLL
jgi:hypothetical protein